MRILSPVVAPAIAIALATPALASPAPVTLPDDGMIPSVATTQDAAGALVNPAGLGWDPGVGLHLTASGPTSGSLALGLGTLGLGLISQGNRQEFSLSLALPFTNSFRGGLSYRLGRVGNTTGGDYDASFLARPNSFLSLGGAARNIGGTLPGVLRNYQLGIAVRPGTDRLTLSLDGAWNDTRTLWQADPILGADLKLTDAISLRGEAQYDPTSANLTARVGLAIGTPNWDIGGLSGPISGAGASLSGTAGYVRYREARGQSPFGGSDVAELKLQGNLGPAPSGLGVLTGMGAIPAIAPTLESLKEAARDPHIVALALTIRNVSASLADVEEVREAIADFRSTGKPVVAYLPSAGFNELYLASAANRVVLNPVGTVDFTGFATEIQYYKTLLDKIGVHADFVKAGPYKDAMEPLMKEHMSAANRSQLEALTQDQFIQVLTGIAQGRHQATDDIAVDVDQGFLTAPQALDAHLVDKLGEPSDLKGELEQLKIKANSGSDIYDRLYRIRDWNPPHVAVVTLSGAISGGAGGNDLLMGRTIGQSTLVNALRIARDDSDIKAVVLRIDSPGGDAIASEAIRDAVERLEHVKPVIISMGGEAASGGYWVACGGSRILADPGTITGSIGVFVGKFSAQGLFDKLGINTETISRGKYATLDSIAHDLTPDQRELMHSDMEFTYGRFLELVSHARHMPQSRVKALAGGHIWSGEAAAQLGLVDKLGGLREALAEAKYAAHLGNRKVVIDFLPEQGPLAFSGDMLDVFDGSFGLDSALSRTARWGRVQAWLLDPRLVP